MSKDYYVMNGWQQFIQNIKCLFGRHLYNRVPAMNITTCPACTRIWNGQKGITLIEFFMVITIIGIVAAITIPQFNAYEERMNAIKVDRADRMETNKELWQKKCWSCPLPIKEQ